MNHLWAVAIKELRQIQRDRRTLMVMLFLPAFFLLLYGYALNFDIRHVALVVQDRDETAESRRLVSRFVDSTYFELVGTASSDAEIGRALDSGAARAVLVIPEGFGNDLAQRLPVTVQVLLNGDNANTATTVLGYTTAVLREASIPAGASVTTRLAMVEPRIWYNPELRSTLFLVPGLIAYISMITAVVSTALSIVREKESGTMEQIRMAPISTPAFIMGKAAPYLVLSQISGILVILAAMALFGLPMHGSWIALNLVLGVFLVGAIGTGLLVSTIAETQQVAFQIGSLVAFLPTFILSGFIFPIASMPIGLQYVSTAVPAKYFLVALRGIVLKGSDLATVWPSVAALAVYAVLVMALASLRLAKR
ncbi:MAG TPA: ABC transporter permease [Vicinamibacterales bacterium]|jgi:ABC-2 type transport system permease protein|nr:ABC transporter permease [Acidobacteriota bacterium]HQX83495.1 ABC transporter permease [Vicinamibacterales bacterium]